MNSTTAIQRIARHLDAPLSATADGFIAFATLTSVQIAPVDGDGFVVARNAQILLASTGVEECVDCAKAQTDEPFHAAYLSDAAPTEARWADIVGRLLGADVEAIDAADDATWCLQSGDQLLMLSLGEGSTFDAPEVALRCKFGDGDAYTWVLFESRDLEACARFARSINSSGFIVNNGDTNLDL